MYLTAVADIWKLIEKMKQNTLIIITTNNMTEAGTLADKIAVLAKGQLR